MKFSLIIPCYNEAASLPDLISRCDSVFRSHNGEVILVDNGSTDDTPAILSELLTGHRFVRSIRINVNEGYGNGILAGLRVAQGRILAWTHADLQTDPGDVLEGVKLFLQNSDTNRLYAKGQRYGRPIFDAFFAVCMSCFETILFRRLFWDINAQPNIFSREFFDSWANPPHDFSLDLYVYYQARKSNLEIIRFPVLFKIRPHGVSHWNVGWKNKFRFISRTWEYSLKLRRQTRLS